MCIYTRGAGWTMPTDCRLQQIFPLTTFALAMVRWLFFSEAQHKVMLYYGADYV